MASVPERTFVIGVPVGNLDRTKAASICQKMSDLYGQCAAIWLNEELQRYEIHMPVGDTTRAGLICYCLSLSNDHDGKIDGCSATESTTKSGHTGNHLTIPDISLNRQAPSLARNNHRARTVRGRRANPKHIPGHIPRPRNSWIIYRSDKTRELRNMNPSLTASDISRITSRLWAEEMADVKVQYQQMAQEEANHHMAMYPDYRYRARRPISVHPKVDSMLFWNTLPSTEATDKEAGQSGSN